VEAAAGGAVRAKIEASVNFDASRDMWTNEGFLIDPHPPSLLEDILRTVQFSSKLTLLANPFVWYNLSMFSC
jgi:hypothetical protein